MLIIDMPMPVKEWNCLDCKALCVDMFRHYCGITKKTIDTLKNMRERPDWCPIKGVLPDVHGEWIPKNNPFTGNCSECGSESNMRDKYCPNCGAKMGKEKADE